MFEVPVPCSSSSFRGLGSASSYLVAEHRTSNPEPERGTGTPNIEPRTSRIHRMRVAIDARKLHDFGIGTYIRNLLRHLARTDHSTEYVLLCGEADLGVAAQLGPNFRAVLEPSPNYSLREQVHVPWVLRRERPDLYHAPHYVLPAGGRCPSVV